MTVTYRESHILAKAAELRPGDIDLLNKVLQEAGLGQPLRNPEGGAREASGSDLVALPVVGADPMAIRDAVRAAASKGGGQLPGLIPDYEYGAGTVEGSAQHSDLFAASGKKSGHGTIAWLPAPSYAMSAGPSWPYLPRPPVIALLDSGVRKHRWLPEDGGPPFVLHAEDHGWQSPLPDPDKAPGPSENYASHWGHATFIAGLIRQAAPGAQVLSMRVMNSNGKVSEAHAGAALKWLVENPKIPVDGVDIVVNIVLMAFGRQADSGVRDLDLEHLRTHIQALSDRGVRIVASAGNDGADRPVYPAAFATEPKLSHKSRQSVASVGALATPTERAPYSNFGPWVTEWGQGTNIISIMPLTINSSGEHIPGFEPAGPPPAAGDGYAWWSGTSFAAATYAGKLAARLQAGQALPEPAAGS